jgi:hypothetical protein
MSVCGCGGPLFWGLFIAHYLKCPGCQWDNKPGAAHRLQARRCRQPAATECCNLSSQTLFRCSRSSSGPDPAQRLSNRLECLWNYFKGCNAQFQSTWVQCPSHWGAMPHPSWVQCPRPLHAGAMPIQYWGAKPQRTTGAMPKPLGCNAPPSMGAMPKLFVCGCNARILGCNAPA